MVWGNITATQTQQSGNEAEIFGTGNSFIIVKWGIFLLTAQRNGDLFRKITWPLIIQYGIFCFRQRKFKNVGSFVFFKSP